MLYAEDPLVRADAILVLAGTRMERPLEAVDLFRAGYAPHIVLTRQVPDGGIEALRARGIELRSDAEAARDVMIRLGVPADAVIVTAQVHDNTAHEAHTLRLLATERGWRRVIVITSKFHTRRAKFALRRELRDTPIDIVVRGTRYDDADPAHWWRTRSGIRWAFSETTKLVAYVLGLGM